jgi:hypothetical protein
MNPATGLLEHPLSVLDPPDTTPLITQKEIVETSTAFFVYQIARAEFELRRAILVARLLRCCDVEPGSYYARLEDGNLIMDDATSCRGDGRDRPLHDTETIPAGGAA